MMVICGQFKISLNYFIIKQCFFIIIFCVNIIWVFCIGYDYQMFWMLKPGKYVLKICSGMSRGLLHNPAPVQTCI